MSRFSKLSHKLGSARLAAYIGRKKYGKKRFQAMAARGRKKKRK